MSAARGDATSAKLDTIGMDAAFKRRLVEQIQAEISALLVLVTRPAVRDQILAVLHDFQGEIMVAKLLGDDQGAWRCAPLGVK